MIYRVNIPNPINNQKGLVGFGQQIDEITWHIKTIYGSYEVIADKITKFNIVKSVSSINYGEIKDHPVNN